MILTVESVDEVLLYNHLHESYEGVASFDAVYHAVQRDSNCRVSW